MDVDALLGVVGQASAWAKAFVVGMGKNAQEHFLLHASSFLPAICTGLAPIAILFSHGRGFLAKPSASLIGGFLQTRTR
jgi:hypothetical protein